MLCTTFRDYCGIRHVCLFQNQNYYYKFALFCFFGCQSLRTKVGDTAGIAVWAQIIF